MAGKRAAPESQPPVAINIPDRFDGEANNYGREHLRLVNRASDIYDEMDRVRAEMKSIERKAKRVEKGRTESEEARWQALSAEYTAWHKYYGKLSDEENRVEKAIQTERRKDPGEQERQAGIERENRRHAQYVKKNAKRSESMKEWLESLAANGETVTFGYVGYTGGLGGMGTNRQRIRANVVQSYQQDGHEFYRIDSGGNIEHIQSMRKGRPYYIGYSNAMVEGGGYTIPVSLPYDPKADAKVPAPVPSLMAPKGGKRTKTPVITEKKPGRKKADDGPQKKAAGGGRSRKTEAKAGKTKVNITVR